MGDPRRARWLLLPLFFGSGFAALLYQMIWQRLLTLFGGADVYSVTIIVSAFMAGLGFGSLAGGYAADRLSPRGRFLAFGAAELAIAAFAFASVPLYYDFLYQRLASLALSRAATAAILLATLLWPTFFMGMSLPLLAKAAALRDRPPEEWISALYGVNTVGAAAGSLVTVWFLAPALGFQRSIHLGALLNLACAAGGFLLALTSRGIATSGEAAHARREASGGNVVPPATFSFPAWALIYGLSGFVALSLEILWFRILGVVLKSNAFTFATLLALYLTGVGGGALVGSRWARRARSPGERFLLLQSAIAPYAGLSLAFFTFAVPRLGALGFLWQYLGDYEGLDIGVALRETPGLFVSLYVLVPLFLVGVPTLLMGVTFALLQRAAQTDPALLGRRVGWLQTANIVGSTLGAIVTGLALLHLLGTAGTLKLLVALGGVFLVLLARVRGRGGRRARRLEVAVALAFVAFAAWLSPEAPTLWGRLHGASSDRVLTAEDGSGLSVLKEHRPPVATSVFVNGLGQSQLPYGGGHTRLGMLPVLLHPHPTSLAIIGLGSGDTVFSAGGRQETERIDCIEIVRPQLETLLRLERRHPYAGLGALLEDTRIHHVFADGRAFIARGGRAYDVIEADALRPTGAYSGNLYSREYFELIREHLNEGGLGVTWGPKPRILDTFLAVFPHVLRFDDILVGSDAPIAFDRAALRARLDEPFTRAYYQRGRIDVEAQLGALLARGPVVYGAETDRSSLADIDTDLFPKDEYRVPQSSPEYR